MIADYRSSMRNLTAALFVLVPLLMGSCSADTRSVSPATYTITIRDSRFQPPVLTVKRGDTVEWKNSDIIPHTATSTGTEFDSGRIAVGDSWKYVANKTGTYAYECSLHPNMQGKLIVE